MRRSFMHDAMVVAGVTPANRLLGESEQRHPGSYRLTHPFDQYLYESRSKIITMKDLGEYRTAFMHILSTHPRMTLVGAYREWLFRPDRDLREFQEAIRVGKELTVYLKNSDHPIGYRGIEALMNLAIANWAWERMRQGKAWYFAQVDLEMVSIEYQAYLTAMEEDKHKNPDLYSLI